MSHRRAVLGVGFAVALGVTASVLSAVIGTLFLAVTAAYVAAVPYRWLREMGLGSWLAGVLTTAALYLASLLTVAPLGFVLYQRRGAVLVFLASLSETYTFDVFGMTVVVTTADIVAAASVAVRDVALTLAAQLPVVGVKFAVFGLAVFALLLRGGEVRDTVMAVTPASYQDVVIALNDRVRETVFALYGLQVATALGTFAIGTAVFWAVGYDLFVTLAFVAALLQFLPIIGPSILIAWLAVVELLAGNVTGALVVGAVGLVFVAALPDLLIRPRLAAYTTDMPGSLYFIGFAGGLLSLGAIGIVAGPVAVALLAAVGDQLADEREPPIDDSPQGDL